MFLRCFLLLLFLIQAGFSPMLAASNYNVKQKLEKSESKSKPVKSDILEEDEDENESEKLIPAIAKDISYSFSTSSNFLYIAKVNTSEYALTAIIPIPIFIWVQNFRI